MCYHVVLQVEPFFVSLALYDAAKGQKISETFHMDLNDRQMQKMLDERGNSEIGEPKLPKDMLAIGASSLNINEKWPVFIKQVMNICKCKHGVYVVYIYDQKNDVHVKMFNGSEEFIRRLWKGHVMDINELQVNDS